MRPEGLKTKIFSDSGNPEDSKNLLQLLGFLDGQTTNPSLIAKNPQAKKRLDEGRKFSKEELNEFYKEVVQEASKLLPHGSISIEVYADANTGSEEMFKQGKEFFQWIPNAHIKFPTTTAGLEAAELSVKEGIRVNLTLVFSQAQAAAVHAATRGASPGQVFVSPFVGRLDDRGECGMDLVKNILTMYRQAESHVEVLTASVRHLNHFLHALKLGSDIITAPVKVLQRWHEAGMPLSQEDLNNDEAGDLTAIEYQELDLTRSWREFDIRHELTDRGLAKFAQDWNSLIQSR